MRIVLASRSPLKHQAVGAHFPQHEVLLPSVDLGALTLTPQPVGSEQALQCCEQRLALALAAHAEADMVLAVENFIEPALDAEENVWYDACVVLLAHRVAGKLCALADVRVRVPAEFAPPRGTAELAETIGERIHAARPHVPANDWYSAFGAQPRQHMIEAALRAAMRKLNALNRVLEQHPMREFVGFPSAGVRFADLFSLTVQPEFNGALVQCFRDRLELWRQQHADAKLVVVGLEARGLMLGYALSCAAALPFVPARKPHKLPGAVERQSFSKEYGSDALEMQSEYLGAATHAVLVDDVIATGGSLLAACQLCERLGLRVALALAVCDVAPLRAQWQAALGAYDCAVVSGF